MQKKIELTTCAFKRTNKVLIDGMHKILAWNPTVQRMWITPKQNETFQRLTGGELFTFQGLPVLISEE